MNLYEELILQDCPYCGGTGLLEEEHGWSWSVICLDCGAQTASFEFQSPETRRAAAESAAHLWNIGKVIRPNGGD